MLSIFQRRINACRCVFLIEEFTTIWLQHRCSFTNLVCVCLCVCVATAQPNYSLNKNINAAILKVFCWVVYLEKQTKTGDLHSVPRLFKISKNLLGQIPLIRILAMSCTQRFPFSSLRSSARGNHPKHGAKSGQDRFPGQSWFIPLSPFVSSNWNQTRAQAAERPLKLSAVPYSKPAKSIL